MMTALSALIVFSTTYALILPAITLDSNRVYDEPGIELDDNYFEDVNYGENPSDAQGLVFEDTGDIYFDGNEPDVYIEDADNGYFGDTYFEDEADNYFENADAGLFVDDENAFLTEDNEAGIYGDVLFDDEAGLLPDPETADSMAVIVEDMIDVDSIVPEAEEPADIFVDDEDEAEYVEADVENVEAEETAAEADDAEIVADDAENDADDVEVSEDEDAEATDEAESEFADAADTEVTASVVEEAEAVYEFMAANAAEMAEAEDTEVSEADEAAEMTEAVASDAEEIESVESQIEEVVDAEEVVSEDEAESVSSEVEEVMDAEKAVPADKVESVSSEVEEVMDAAESVSSEVEEVMDVAESVSSEVEEVMDAAESVSSEVEEVMDAADSTLSEVEEMIDSTDSTTSEVEDIVTFDEATWSGAESMVESVPSYANGVEDIEEVYPAVDFYRATPYVSVKVHADEGAFPAGTTMTVEDVEDEETITAITEAAEETEAKVRKLHAVNITFLNVDGQEIEPLIPISVEIRSEQIAENEKAMVVHVDDDGNATALNDVEVEAKRNSAVAEVTKEGAGEEAFDDTSANEAADSFSENAEDIIVFDADEFSVYAIVYTVDFHWEVDGKEYEFSLAGGDSISFSKLIDALHILETEPQDEEFAAAADEEIPDDAVNEPSDANAEFINDIEDIKFSSPELVWVGKLQQDLTAGEIAELSGLDVEYSAELLEEEIAAFKAKAYAADEWVLLSVKPFTTEESLMVSLKDGEVFTIKVTDAQIKKTVISASGDTYEITVTYGDDAHIPDDAELQVREITEEDENYDSLCVNAQNTLQQEEKDLQKPVLFDISIVSGGEEIEPAENSIVKVDIKLIRSALKGIYSDEGSPLLINEEPMAEANGEIAQDIQVLHQLKDGAIEIVDTQDVVGDEDATATFTTSSFSDWLLFLDETVENITIGVNDTLTLRPYSKWVWKSSEEVEPYVNYQWKVPQNSNVISFSRERKYDDQLREEYYFYHGKATQTGSFDLQLVDGNNVKHTIHVTVVNDVPDTPTPIPDENKADIKINLFDYDINSTDVTKSGSLDARGNTAANPTNSTVNVGHDLKFLGWGGGNVSGWSINNYSQDEPNPGIVQNRLTGGYPTLSTGNHQSLDYLFNTSTHDASVWAFPDVNGLFQKDADGYYYYNSNSNYAYYDSNNNKFVLYDHTYSQWTSGSNGHNAKPIGFFPFHKYDSYLKEGDVGMNFNTNLNHHFGMSMAVDFEIPSDGLDEYGNPIVFEFSGDDDMWVFIDDNLVLDVGGIHQPVTGKINFSSDKVEVFKEADTTITQRFQDAGSPKAWEIGDGKPHTMKIFYLERGGCDSNLSVKFNTPIRYGKGKLALVKREKDKTIPLKDAKFGIWDNAKCQGDPIGEYTTDENGNINFGEFVLKSSTDTYYLKEMEQPNGYIRDTNIYQIKPRLNGQGEAVKDSSGDYVILDIFDKDGNPLTKLQNDSVVFPNTKLEEISIPAEKKWIGGAVNDATVTLTIKRFKLIDITKGFMIVKELWGEPDNYNDFNALYRITYPNGTQKTVNYNEFNNGVYGIEDAVPGEYLIEEDVRSTAPNGYHMEHTDQSITVTLNEDDTALAYFKTTFVKDMGKLYIKENLTVQNGSYSDIDYSSVRYAVLDENGKKVTSVTHAQAAEGVTLDLPVGTYSVKAASVPDTPVVYDRTEQYVVSGNNRIDGTVLNNIIVTADDTTPVNFNTKYVRLNNAQNCTWKITDRHNGAQYASGNVPYPAGTIIQMTFQVPQNSVWDDFEVSYGGSSLTGSRSNVQNNYEFSVQFVVRDNAELNYKVNKNKGNNMPITGPVFEPIGREATRSANRMTFSARKAAANSAQTINVQNEAKHPEAPEGKKYVKDSTWSETVVLNSGNNWRDEITLKDLPATDDEGNLFYYYVESVVETGLPEGTVCDIDLDGKDLLLIGQDQNADKTLSVTNTLPGSLKITKEVTVNRTAVTDHTKSCPADGKYTFKLTKKDDADFEEQTEITITNGKAVTNEIKGLSPGTYIVTEVEPTNGTELDKINGLETAVYSAELEVQAGKTGDNAPNVTFTNNIVDTKIKVIKVEKGTENPVPGAKFTLTRVGDDGNPTTGEAAYSSEKEVDSTTGELEFTGLKSGRYKLEETHVPEGYVKKESFYYITIGKDGSGALDTSIPHEMISPDSGNEYTVENEPGAALPSTGGFGTKPFTIGGMMLVLMSLMLYCIGGRRRTLAEEFSIGASGSAGKKGGDPRL